MVAPFTGARIETWCAMCAAALVPVAPFTGARIETANAAILSKFTTVAPFTGARIETVCWIANAAKETSLPSRERGLKQPRTIKR